MKSMAKHVTIDLDLDLYEALQRKAVNTSRSLSKLVNVAIRESLLEDVEDWAAFSERNSEPLISYSEMLQKIAVQ